MMSYYTPYSALQDLLRYYNANKNETDKLPMIPYHGLRHTSATLLIAAHQDVRTVSNRLGHAQASTTMNIYTRALKENDCTAWGISSPRMENGFWGALIHPMTSMRFRHSN